MLAAFVASTVVSVTPSRFALKRAFASPRSRRIHRARARAMSLDVQRARARDDDSQCLSFNASLIGDNALKARKNLLAWYDARARDLPWRRRRRTTTTTISYDERARERTDLNDDDERAKRKWRERAFDTVDDSGAREMDDDQYAYGVLVSEIMSQQTQIERVAEYWRRWTDRWPTVESLARATQDEVNEEWAGLGYYRRAKYLLDGARYVRDELDGKYPRTVEELLRVPGVGPYTASAVASIAFGEASAAVDGNVHRVIARACCIRGDPLKGAANKEIREMANALIDPERAGDFNQAMMELGATTCTPKNPKCEQCPLREWCAGLERERATSGVFKVTELPEVAKKAPKREEQRAFCVVRKRAVDGEDMYLLQKRPEIGLLAGLWEFPNALVAEESDDAFSARPAKDLKDAHEALFEMFASAYQSRENVETPLAGKVTHAFSHIRQVMHFRVADLDADADLDAITARHEALRWFPSSSFAQASIFSTSVQKLYAKVVGAKTHTPSGAGKRLRDDVRRARDDSQRAISDFFVKKPSS